jgi:hypothetical protein
MKLRERAQRWWQGKPIDDPRYGRVGYRRHWSSRAARALTSFYLRHWYALWSLAIGIAAVIVAYLALK